MEVNPEFLAALPLAIQEEVASLPLHGVSPFITGLKTEKKNEIVVHQVVFILPLKKFLKLIIY